jgi:hypothetical protein
MNACKIDITYLGNLCFCRVSYVLRLVADTHFARPLLTHVSFLLNIIKSHIVGMRSYHRDAKLCFSLFSRGCMEVNPSTVFYLTEAFVWPDMRALLSMMAAGTPTTIARSRLVSSPNQDSYEYIVKYVC